MPTEGEFAASLFLLLPAKEIKHTTEGVVILVADHNWQEAIRILKEKHIPFGVRAQPSHLTDYGELVVPYPPGTSKFPALTQRQNHLSRAVYSLPQGNDYIEDVVFEDEGFKVTLKMRPLPPNFTSELIRRLESIYGVKLTGMDTLSGKIIIFGHFEHTSGIMRA